MSCICAYVNIAIAKTCAQELIMCHNEVYSREATLLKQAQLYMQQ